MLKTMLTGAVCLAAAGVLMWATSYANPREVPVTFDLMPSIDALHGAAARQGLPIEDVRELY
jgi:hypothetical protein